jgi:SpoVK/Ycf46/Vps4 family AAA+-type ATPase
MIDPAMLRPGRLDKPLFVQLPTAEERSEIIKALAKRLPVNPSVNLSTIANNALCKNFRFVIINDCAPVNNLVVQISLLCYERLLFLPCALQSFMIHMRKRMKLGV